MAFDRIIVPPDVSGGNEVNTDKIGTKHTPIHKIAFGVEGTVTPVDGSNPLPVNTGGLTDAQLRATAVPVSGTFWQATQPISAASLPLPTGAATETTLAALNTKTPALGQALMASSSPVVLASDHTVIRVTDLGATTTGTITALNGNVALSVSGNGAAVIDIRGTFVATVTFQGSIDGTNWINLFSTPYGSSANAAIVATTTGSGAWLLQCAGCTQVRAIATAFTSGTITATLRAIQSPAWSYVCPTNTTWAVSGTVTSNIGTGTLAAVTSANLGIPFSITDVASAALTTTTTTAAFTPTFGTTYIINIPVTVVSGTNPTLDVVVQESDDAGTNWFDVYHFQRITATNSYRSPPLTLRGNRVRYVQTVTGTTPSFTRAINRLQRSDDAPLRCQFINRTIEPNTLNSTTPSYFVAGLRDFNFTVRCTAQSSAATITVQFSHDGTNWHTTSNTLTTAVGIAHAKVQNEQWKFARLIVTGAGTGVTLGEAMIVGTN